MATFGSPDSAANDPVTREVVRHAITSIADEMVLIIVKAARSGVVKHNMDFSTAICDPAGRLVVQGLSLPLHLGAIPDAVRAVVKQFGHSIEPGDVFLLNDPYQGGMHLPDIFMIQPLYSRNQMLGYAACVCHHTDVGGRIAGSNASDSTEIYQEGLRIPPVYFRRGGEMNDTLIRIIEKNTRLPQAVLGDLGAQLSACTSAEQGMCGLANRYGEQTLSRYLDAVLDYSEHRTRQAIQEWPDGRYSYTDYLDDDGIDETPITINVTITVSGSNLTVDFDGTSQQVKGAINSTLSFTRAATYGAIKYVLGGDIPANDGFFRPIRVIAPSGTVVNGVSPAACAARGVTGFRVGDAVFGALAQVQPQSVFAACDGGNTCVSIGGYRDGWKPFVFVEFSCANWGARPDCDGVDGSTDPLQNLANQSIEVIEAEQPLRIERYEFAPDSGGAGRFRGGLGIVREYRLLAKEATVQVRSDRRRFPPYGLFGGHPGAGSTVQLSSEAATLPTKFTRTMFEGDVLSIRVPGGGGYGLPTRRDPRLVLDDVLSGKVGVEVARSAYGVDVDVTLRRVNDLATRQLRSRLSSKRPCEHQA